MPHIILGISGGIAAYKAASVASQLTQQGCKVSTILTAAASKFITPLTLQALTGQPVATDLFSEPDPSVIRHIALAESADLVLVAPATANQIASLAQGLAGDLLSTLLLATRAPVVFAPAMNPRMYDHPAVRVNREILQSRGVSFVPPGTGRMACGSEGEGRLAEPEVIVQHVKGKLSQSQGNRSVWQQRTVLITAGPTIEPIDPMRYLTNRSSGKMGYALAGAAQRAGAKVLLISGPVSLSPPLGVQVIPAETAADMLAKVQKYLSQVDVAFFVAAVCDFRPQQFETEKKPKPVGEFFLPCVLTADIAAWAGKQRRPGQFLLGFAAETGNPMSTSVQARAEEKRRNKKLDAIVINQVGKPMEGAGSDTNRFTICYSGGKVIHWSLATKYQLADQLVAWVGGRLDYDGRTDR
ncbi:bifunctional phosphopantothenoylcysteine decarboxylase/phosphopantothenate--cysteine ligase CoaBC [Pasteuria penetrans]|uniref:bifunctional phosphopantothenoylcysteine decarboxylase/phosphopantothenate--cysteine ligase CoaBC n=1 Tax=Pasteuria penetrans TaxID=86005 RepID=UPI000F91A510|nr:bifunctional phosphopantothenoylcysteine decarboxylase/phosphopantothenate--cysteine ligase CoaBC [Pasteuria penetrans]